MGQRKTIHGKEESSNHFLLTLPLCCIDTRRRNYALLLYLSQSASELPAVGHSGIFHKIELEPIPHYGAMEMKICLDIEFQCLIERKIG